MAKTIGRSWLNQQVTFFGFDGKSYLAFVSVIRNGVATLHYAINGERITAYISDRDRLRTIDRSEPHVWANASYYPKAR